MTHTQHSLGFSLITVAIVKSLFPKDYMCYK